MPRQFQKIVIASILCVATFALAQQPAVDHLPQTPAGQAFAKLLLAIESGDHEKYITENFGKGFFEAFSLADHLDFFRQMQMMHGGFVVTEKSVEKSTPYALTAVVKSKKRDAWRRIELTISPEAPHKITGFGIDTAEGPGAQQKAMPQMTEAQILDHVQKELEKLTQADRFSGAILIAKNGQPILQKAYDMASKEFSVPNTIDTKFNIGSINKSFTKMAIAQLLEKGKIRLEDTVGQYRPDFPKAIADKVTIAHLLSMRSGMGSYWNDEWRSKWATIKSVEALIEIIKKIPLDFEPGTRRQYSNAGYVVLGAIIEKVTGQNYYDYVREHIYKPAGMHETDSYELDQIVPNLARGYTQNRAETPYQGNKLQNNLFLHSVKGAPAGGGYSTIGDLNRYVEALKHNKLASEKFTNLVLGGFEDGGEGDRRPQGLGIAGGAPVGINAGVEADFEAGYTVIVLSNYDPPVAEEFALKTMRMLLHQKSS